jgi:hypothetical protein
MEAEMLNPAYSIEEQADELLSKAEDILAKWIHADNERSEYAILGLTVERWQLDLERFRQRRLLATATEAPAIKVQQNA